MKEPIRAPKIVGDVEFNKSHSGFGSDEVMTSMTQFEAKLCVRHWLSMLWAVETTWALGTSGSWECSMYQYANYRLECIEKSGLLTREAIQAIADQWDWPSFDEDDETCNGEEYGEFEEPDYSQIVTTNPTGGRKRAQTVDW